MIGKSVGNYRVVDRLGEGGMGEVYLAAHPDLGRKAAVKVLRPDLAGNGENVVRFFNEARAADAIRHPAIVRVLDLGSMPSGAPYIVMEHLEGETLAARLERAGRLDASTAAAVAARTADALQAAHTAGIVHRDLKPANLFLVAGRSLADPEALKVLDFGIAKLAEPWRHERSPKTESGMVLGTPVYMSPELCSGAREVDHRTDIYSLGVILYEMLCGTPPFRSSGFGELAHLHLGTPPTPPRARNPAVPEPLQAIVLRALEKEPGQRFASMAELRAALDAWSAGAPAAPGPGRTRRRAWLAALVVVPAAAAVIAGRRRRVVAPPSAPDPVAPAAPTPVTPVPAPAAAAPAPAPVSLPPPPARAPRKVGPPARKPKQRREPVPL
jgi:eukaryotic-like serine/threonine-protein kinase